MMEENEKTFDEIQEERWQQLRDWGERQKEKKRQERGVSSRWAKKLSSETPEERQKRLEEKRRERERKLTSETPEEKQKRLDCNRERRQERLARESHTERELRLLKRRDYYHKKRREKRE